MTYHDERPLREYMRSVGREAASLRREAEKARQFQKELRKAQIAPYAGLQYANVSEAVTDTSMGQQWHPVGPGTNPPVTQQFHDPAVAAQLSQIGELLRVQTLAVEEAFARVANALTGLAEAVERNGQLMEKAAEGLGEAVDRNAQLLEEVAEGVRLAVDT